MNQSITKTLLVAAAMLAGSGMASADTLTSVADHVVSISKGAASDAWVGQVDGDFAHVNNTTGSAWVGNAYAQISLAIPEGMGIQSANLQFWATGEGRRARSTNVMYVNPGIALDLAAFEAPTGNINLDATLIQSVDFPQSANGTDSEPQLFNIDVTSIIQNLASTQNYAIFKWTGDAGGGDLWAKEGYKPTLTIQLVGSEMSTVYTVTFVDSQGNTLKESKAYPGVVAEKYTAPEEDLLPFFSSDNSIKYVYSSGNDVIIAAKDPAQNVIELTFREANKYTWTVNMVNSEGKAIAEPNTGEAWEGTENVMGDFKKYILHENVFYQVDPGQGPQYNNLQFQTSFGAINDDVAKDITYSECTDSLLSGVVYCAEGEEIPGLTASSAGNAPVRASNGAIGDASEAVEITSLEKGTYQIIAGLFKSGGSFDATFTNKAGEELFAASCGNANLNQLSSSEFELTDNDVVSVLTNGHRTGNGVDYVIIRKIVPFLEPVVPDPSDPTDPTEPTDSATTVLKNVVNIVKKAADEPWYSQINEDFLYVNNSYGSAWVGNAYAEFGFTIPEGMGVKSANLQFWATGEDRRARPTNVMYVNPGIALDLAAFEAAEGNINLDATLIQSVDFPQSADGTESEPAEFNLDVTKAIQNLANAQDYVIFKWTGNPGGGHLWNKEGYKPALTLELVGADQMTTYTVTFSDRSGNQLKDPKVYPAVVGGPYVVPAEDLEPFFTDDNSKKYIYRSGNKEITAMADSAANVISLVFREAKKFPWTVNMLNTEGFAIAEPNTGEAWEGTENVMGDFRKYIFHENVFYEVDPEHVLGGRQFQVNLGTVNDSVAMDVYYSVCADSLLSNVIYAAEGEDIEGFELCTTPNAALRASNGKATYAPEDVKILDVEPGTYQIVAGVFKAGSGEYAVEFTDKDGNVVTALTASAANLNHLAGEEFTFSSANSISFKASGNANRGLDYIIIRKLAPFLEPVVPDPTEPTDTTTVLKNVVNIVKKAADEPWYSQINEDFLYVNNSYGSAWVGNAYAEFGFTIPEGMGVKSANLQFWATGEDRRARPTNVMYVNPGIALDLAAFEAAEGNINLDATLIQSVDFPQSADGTESEPAEFNLDVTKAIQNLANAQDYVIFKWTGNPGGGHLWNKEGYKPALTLELVGADQMTTYTVTFSDRSGNQLKDPKVYPAVVGGPYVVPAEDLEPFFTDDNSKKYIYRSGNKEITAMADSAANVISLVFREAKKFPWTVNMLNTEGFAIAEPNTGEAWEGTENVMGDFRKYIFHENVFYEVDPEHVLGGRQFQVNLGTVNDSVAMDVYYSVCADSLLSNVIYAAEGEDIEGFELCTTPNAALRASNGKATYAPEDVKILDVEPGTYQIVAGVFKAGSGEYAVEFTDKDGNVVTALTASAANLNHLAGEEFTFSSANSISFKASGNANRGLDYIILRKFEVVPDSTFYTVNFLDEAGKAIKEPKILPAEVGEQVKAADEDLDAFETEDYLYTYASGNTPIVVVDDPEANNINLVFSAKRISTSVTVNFLNPDGEALREARSYKVRIGASITAPEAALQSFWREGVRYNYESGDQTLVADADSTLNVMTLVFAPEVDATPTVPEIEVVVTVTEDTGTVNVEVEEGLEIWYRIITETPENAARRVVAIADGEWHRFEGNKMELEYSLSLLGENGLTLETKAVEPISGKESDPKSAHINPEVLESGVDSITTDNEGTFGEDDELYNIYGQRVSRDYHGVVIKNGKKYFNRR